jgi:autotransporter-associated beta strand protein
VWDAETAAGSLTVTGTSSNPTLLPNANINFGGSGADRTITLTPAPNQSGTANVTVTVADAQGQTAQTTFQFSVTNALAVNGDQDDVDEPDVFRIVRLGSFLDIYRNNPTSPILHLDYATAPAIAINGLGGNDAITVDYSGGNPVPANGLTIDGGDATDALSIVNTAGNDAITLTPGNVSLGTGAAFSYSNAETMTLGVGSGQDTLTVSGNAGVSVSALNLNVTGPGKLTMASGSTLPDFTDLNVTNATFDVSGQNQTIDALSGNGTVLNNGAAATTLTIGQSDGSGTFSGTIANGTSAISVSKIGTGTETLSGSNSYTGTTTVDAGALRVTNASALGAATSGTTINGGSSTGRVEFSGGVTVPEPFTLGNRTGGGGGNFAAHLLNVSGNNTLTGAIALATGGSYWTIQSNAGKLTVVGSLTNANTTNTRTLFLRGAGDGEVSGPILQTNLSLTQVNKEDAGTWTLSGNNTYSGATNANGGTLHLATAGTLGSGGVNVGPSALLDILSGRATALKIPSVLIAAGGTMDLQDNDLIVASATPPQTLLGYVQQARNGGAWDGTGLTSSIARDNAQHNTTLGLLTGAEFNSVGGAGTFSGQPYDTSDTLIKYTWYGDTDFNGRVNFDDYVRTDNGFNNHLGGWLNGDFDGNGTVNFDDYVLIDLAFNTQGGTLGKTVAPRRRLGRGQNQSFLVRNSSYFLGGSQMHRNQRKSIVLAAAVAAGFVQAGVASAAIHTWSGATDSFWGTAGNWTSNAVPNANTEDVVFNTPGAGNLNVDTSVGTITIRSLTFNTDATNQVILNVAPTRLFTIAGPDRGRRDRAGRQPHHPRHHRADEPRDPPDQHRFQHRARRDPRHQRPRRRRQQQQQLLAQRRRHAHLLRAEREHRRVELHRRHVHDQQRRRRDEGHAGHRQQRKSRHHQQQRRASVRGLELRFHQRRHHAQRRDLPLAGRQPRLRRRHWHDRAQRRGQHQRR